MIEKNRKKIRTIWYCCILTLCLGLGMSKSAFSLSDNAFYALYWLLILIILVSWYTVNNLWYQEFIRSVEALMPILTEEKNPDRFILENEKLLVGKKSAQIKATLHINLCLAYCEKGNYEEAKRQLEAINHKKIYGIQRVIYLADFAYVLFYLNDITNALVIMEQNRKYFDKLKDSQAYGGLIAILYIFSLLGEPEKARILYDVERARWENNRNRIDFDHLKKLLYKDVEL